MQKNVQNLTYDITMTSLLKARGNSDLHKTQEMTLIIEMY